MRQQRAGTAVRLLQSLSPMPGRRIAKERSDCGNPPLAIWEFATPSSTARKDGIEIPGPMTKNPSSYFAAALGAAGGTLAPMAELAMLAPSS
ncbi:MAG: hypothetical protein PVF67_02700, partial [Anaerolineae bacterium]